MDGGLRKLFKQNIATAHWQSIESLLTGSGIPDANACRDGHEVWIEFKQCKAFKVHNVKPGQVAWHEQRTRYGGKTFIAVRQQADAGKLRLARDELWLLRGLAARPLIDKCRLDELPKLLVLGQWGGGPGFWDWNAVARCLWPTAR